MLESSNISNILNNLSNKTLDCHQEFNKNLLSNELTQFLKFLDFFQSLVLITGIILNILNIIVLLNSKLNESPYTYLTTLAFSDLFTLLSRYLFPYFRLLVKHIDESLLPYFNLYIDIPVNNIFISCSIYITLALTIERFIFVTSPFKAVSICRKSKARKVCFFVVAISIAKSVYLPFMYKKSACGTEIYEQHKSTVLDVFQFLIDLAIPYFTIFIINIALIRSLKKKYIHINSSITFDTQDNIKLKPLMIPRSKSDYGVCDRRKLSVLSSSVEAPPTTSKNLPKVHVSVRRQLSCHLQDKDSTYRRTSNEKEAKNQRKLTRSLIAILCCLLICHLPNFLLEESIIEAIFGHHYNSKTAFNLRQSGWRIAIILIYINCSANFVIYCISNKKFYNSSKLLLSKWKYKTIEFYSRCCCVKSSTNVDQVSKRASWTSCNYKKTQSTSQSSKISFRTSSSFKTTSFKTPITRIQEYN